MEAIEGFHAEESIVLMGAVRDNTREDVAQAVNELSLNLLPLTPVLELPSENFLISGSCRMCRTAHSTVMKSEGDSAMALQNGFDEEDLRYLKNAFHEIQTSGSAHNMDICS
uniref:Peptidase_M16_C domain-containing protein n=1 Tax=Ascaris lumbricoides TaxID=6252 RepID=A0A0M3I4I0_ASCLU